MKIVIEVEGGAVLAITSDHAAEQLEVVVVDYDNIAAGDPDVGDTHFADGETAADLIISGVSIF